MDEVPQSKQQKRAIKSSKNNKNKKEPLKVVYITNPIMFKADTASEFRALVQEYTGQDAETPEYSGCAAAHGGGGEAAEAVLKAAAKDDDNARRSTVDTYKGAKVEAKHDEYYYPNCHDMVMNGHENAAQIGSDSMVFDSMYGDVFNDPMMLESVDGLEGSSLWQESFSSSSTATSS